MLFLTRRRPTLRHPLSWSAAAPVFGHSFTNFGVSGSVVAFYRFSDGVEDATTASVFSASEGQMAVSATTVSVGQLALAGCHRALINVSRSVCGVAASAYVPLKLDLPAPTALSIDFGSVTHVTYAADPAGQPGMGYGSTTSVRVLVSYDDRSQSYRQDHALMRLSVVGGHSACASMSGSTLVLSNSGACSEIEVIADGGAVAVV